MVHSWLSALQAERLEQRTIAISERLKACNGDWEATYFVSLARNFGFGINGDAFEQWAKTIPFHAVDHHRKDLLVKVKGKPDGGIDIDYNVSEHALLTHDGVPIWGTLP